MRSVFEVADTTCYAALPSDKILGLLAFASCQIGPYRLDGLQVRRDRKGGHFVKWPAHKDSGGYEHPYLEVVDLTIRGSIHDAVEQAVLKKAREEGLIQ